MWCQLRIFCHLLNSTLVPKINGTALWWIIVQHDKKLITLIHISFLCITYKTWQINMEFSENFKWTGFLYTLNWVILAVRNELNFMLHRRVSFQDFLGRKTPLLNNSHSCQLHYADFLCK